MDSIHVLLLHAYMYYMSVPTYYLQVPLPTKQLHVCKVRSGLRFTSVVEVGGMVSPRKSVLVQLAEGYRRYHLGSR